MRARAPTDDPASQTDIATVQALRRDVAIQIARFIKRRQLNQLAAARLLSVPQPTISQIMNGRISELSLELLIRIAVRAGMPLVLRTGQSRKHASAAFSTGKTPPMPAHAHSRLAADARRAVLEATSRLTPEQRLRAFLTHSELMMTLYRVGQRARTIHP